MSIFSGLLALARGTFAAPGPAVVDASIARLAEWEAALQGDRLPGFVSQRLGDAASGKTPWISTMTPAELLLSRSHGIRPIATVSGTCWFHYGYSWTEGHAQGWHIALARLRREAVAAGANAVVDVKLRTLPLGLGSSMDYTVSGTAVRVEGLPPSEAPVVATLPAMEFARLLETGIVPVGVAIGAEFAWSDYSYGGMTAAGSWSNQPLRELGSFWEMVRRRALLALRADTERQGTGVLAHTHFGQLFRIERDKQPTRFLGRHIVIGTVIDSPRNASFMLPVHSVVDMRDEASPLHAARGHGHNAYSSHRGNDEGEI